MEPKAKKEQVLRIAVKTRAERLALGAIAGEARARLSSIEIARGRAREIRQNAQERAQEIVHAAEFGARQIEESANRSTKECDENFSDALIHLLAKHGLKEIPKETSSRLVGSRRRPRAILWERDVKPPKAEDKKPAPSAPAKDAPAAAASDPAAPDSKDSKEGAA